MTASIRDCVELNNGVKMPWLGFGTFRLEEESILNRCVRCALDHGYRSIDTASFYNNEEAIGRVLRERAVAREEIFITTKIWNADQRSGRVRQAFDESLSRLDVDYIDLYLVHWPVENKFKETWKILEEIYHEGRVRAIGVSNFMASHLNDLLSEAETIPAVNQVEFHPRLVQPGLMALCGEKGIRLEAWGPLMRGEVLSESGIVNIASAMEKTSAQVVLRWDLQHGVITIPKSAREERIIANADIFDFELSPAEMKEIDAHNSDKRLGPDPFNFDF